MKQIASEIDHQALSNRFSPEVGLRLFLKNDSAVNKALKLLSLKPAERS